MLTFLRGLARRRWLWVSAGLVALYAASGFWLVPRILASAARDTVSEKYQRTLRLGLVKFNPFTLELEVHDVELPDADGRPLLAFDRLYIDLAVTSLLRAGLDFQAIELDRPRLHAVRRKDGRVNIEDLSSPPDPNADPNAPPPRLWIQKLAIRDGAATWNDLDRSTPLALALRPIAFTLRDFSARGDGNAYALAVESTRGERLAWRGTFALAPLASRGTFKLSHVQAQTLADIAESLPFSVTSGELDLNGSYVFATRRETLQANVSDLDLRQLGLRARGETRDTLHIPQLRVHGTSADAVAHTLTVEQIQLEGPQLNVDRGKDGSLNLQRLLPEHAGAGSSSSGPAWDIALPEIRIERAELDVTDHGPTQPAPLRIAPLDLQVHGFASPQRGALEIALDTGVEPGGQLHVAGQLTLEPMSGRFELDANGLPLRALQPYLSDHTGLIVKNGRARLKGTLTLNADHSIVYEGQAGVDDLHSVDDVLDEDFLKWRSLDLLGLRVRSEPLAFAVDQVVAREPYARMIVAKDGSTNIQDVLAREPQPTAAGGAAPAQVARSSRGQPVSRGKRAATPAVALARANGAQGAPPESALDGAQPTAAATEPGGLPIEIGVVRVEDGSVNFSDMSIKPIFTTGVQHIAGTIKGLSARPDARADVELAGQVARYTPVTITGKVNYFAAQKHTRLRLAFRNLELTGLSPYSGKFAGYKIERGKLNVDFNYRVDDRRLDAQHKLNVNQLQLGDHVDSPDATGLPVKLAVALLKDRNGVIDLDLPVSGNLDDPQFRVGPILWKAFLNLLVKVVTSPFALLGSLFGGGEEISYIDFTPGSGTLDANALGKLQTLAKALDSRPSLNLDVPLVVEPQVDRAALTEQRWHEDISERAAKRLGARSHDPRAVSQLLGTARDYRALLEATYRQQFGKRAEIPLPAQPAPPAPKPAPTQTAVQRVPHLVGPGHGALAPRVAASAARSSPAQSSAARAVSSPPLAAVASPAVRPVPGRSDPTARGALAPRKPAKEGPPAIPDPYAITWLEQQLKSRIRVGAPELDALAQKRAENVQAALLDGTGIDPSRVFVISAAPLSPARGPLRMQLSLH